MTVTEVGTAPQKRPWVKWLAVGCGLAIVLTICFVVGVFFIAKKATAGPEAAVHEFLAAAGAGDYAKAHSYYSIPFKETQPLDKFQELVKAHPSMFKIRNTTFNSRSVDLSGAHLSGHLTLESGSELPCSFTLVSEHGAWKLESYRIGED